LPSLHGDGMSKVLFFFCIATGAFQCCPRFYPLKHANWHTQHASRTIDASIKSLKRRDGRRRPGIMKKPAQRSDHRLGLSVR
jgi:hypothetical protein